MSDESANNNDAGDREEGLLLLVSAQMLAKRLQLSVRTLWRLRSAGKLPKPVRLGGSVRWRVTDINAWVDAGCPGLQLERDARKAKSR